MKLSEITKKESTDNDIQKIVYENVDDNGKGFVYGLVFGNSMLINERVSTAVDAYKNNRIKKSYLVMVIMELVIKIMMQFQKQ